MSAGFQAIVPIVTPYAEDGGLDAGALAAHAEVLAEGGVDGSFVGGTNGEGPLLSDDEVIEATRSVAAAAVTPYCLALTADGALEHYGTLIEAAAGTEVYAYVIPAYARNDLEPELVGRLAAQGLAGIKDSTKSSERHRAYVALRRRAPGGRFETFDGDDGMTLDAFRMGSSGGVAYADAVRAPLPRHRAGVARLGIAAEPALDEERAAQPDSGRVFAAAVAVPGPPTARFLGRLPEPALHDRGAG